MRRLVTMAVCALPGLALAEGAALTFDCTVDQICEEGSTCAMVDVPVEIVVSPVEVAADGSGDVIVRVGAAAWDGTADGFAGPWRWADDAVANVLTPGEDGAAIWERTPQETPEITTRSFLTCEVTQ